MGDGFKPVTIDDLHVHWLESSPGTPLVLYGQTADPTKQVEGLAERLGIKLRPFLIRHEKSERGALKELKRYGFGKGHWIYIALEHEPERVENFLRQLGVALKSQQLQSLHR